MKTYYGNIIALHGVDIDIYAGEIVALIGANGAGKSTLMMTICGNPQAREGQILYEGQDITRMPTHEIMRLSISQAPEGRRIFPRMTVLENLRFYARLYDLPAASERIDALLERVGLYGRRSDRVDSLSRGLQQRLAIARALLHEPRLLLLDEPDTGLDLPAFQILESLLAGGPPGRTIVMATHNLQQAARVCRRGLVLVAGRLAAADSIDAIDAARLGDLYRRPAAAWPAT